MKTFGCIRSPLDIRDYKFRASAANLPEEFSLEYNHNIKNQGLVSSCTAHATASILEYHSGNTTRLSTDFIYGIRRKLFNDTGLGMSLRNACKISLDYGDMEYADCPGNHEIERVFEYAEKAFNSKENLDLALKYKIKSYVNLFNDEETMKSFIINNGPILCCIEWPSGTRLDQSYTLDYSRSDRSRMSYHAILIYGWKDNKWLCQNSWGEDWGDNGLFKINFGDGIVETFGLINNKDIDDNSDDSNIVDPTHKIKLIKKIFKIINYIIINLQRIFGKKV